MALEMNCNCKKHFHLMIYQFQEMISVFFLLLHQSAQQLMIQLIYFRIFYLGLFPLHLNCFETLEIVLLFLEFVVQAVFPFLGQCYKKFVNQIPQI